MKLVIRFDADEIRANDEAVTDDNDLEASPAGLVVNTLLEAGFKPDKDFTTLYAGAWSIVGIQLTRNHVAQVDALTDALVLTDPSNPENDHG